MPLLQTLTNDFSTGLYPWQGTVGKTGVEGGQGYIDHDSTYPALLTTGDYDARGSYIYARVTAATGNYTTIFKIQSTASQAAVEIVHVNGTLYLRRIEADGTQAAEVLMGTYNPNVQGWWRLGVNADGSQVTASFSSDGTSWQTGATTSISLAQANPVNFQFVAGAPQGSLARRSYIDSVNLAPTAPTGGYTSSGNAALATLSETFTADNGTFYGSEGKFGIENGSLYLDADATFPITFSTETYDAGGSYVFAEIDPGAAASGEYACIFKIETAEDQHGVQLVCDRGQMHLDAVDTNGGTASVDLGAYDPADMAYWRLNVSADGTTASAQFSPDSAAWTTAGSTQTYEPAKMASVIVKVIGGYDEASTTDQPPTSRMLVDNLNVAAILATGRPKMSTLTTSFDTGFGTVWDGSPGQTGVTGQQAYINQNSSYPALFTTVTYDVRSSFLFAQIGVGGASATTGGYLANMGVGTTDNASEVQIVCTNGAMRLERKVNGTALANINLGAYSAAMGWWRLDFNADGSQVTVSFATDGVTWNPAGTWATNLTTALGAVQAVFVGGADATSTTSTVTVDNVNIPGTASGGQQSVFRVAGLNVMTGTVTPTDPQTPSTPTTPTSVKPYVSQPAGIGQTVTLRQGSDAGPRLKIASNCVWGIHDEVTGAVFVNGKPFWQNQYDDRVNVVNKIVEDGFNAVRLRFLCSDYNKQSNGISKATRLQQLKDWCALFLAKNIYVYVCFWDSLDGDYCNKADGTQWNWTSRYAEAFPAMRDVMNALGTDPRIFVEPWNEPNHVSWDEWRTVWNATIDYYRDVIGYKNLILVDTIDFSHKYNDAYMQELERRDAAKSGMNGKHQLSWCKHDYANEGWPNGGNTFDPNKWHDDTGGGQTHHLIFESEVGNYNGTPDTVHLSWSAQAMTFFADEFNNAARPNYMGASPFVMGQWSDGNAITLADNRTLTEWGSYVVNNFVKRSALTPPPPVTKITTLVESFTAQSQLFLFPTGTGVVNGVAYITPGNGPTNNDYRKITSVNRYDGVGSALRLKVLSQAVGGTTPTTTIEISSQTAGTDFAIVLTGNDGKAVAGVRSGNWTFDYGQSVQWPWQDGTSLRLTEANGTVVLETQAPGTTTWIKRANPATSNGWTTPSWWNSLNVQLGAYNAGGTSSDATFDNINS